MIYKSLNDDDTLIAIKVIKKPYWKISGTGWLCYRETKTGIWNVFSQPNDPYLKGKVLKLVSDYNNPPTFILGWNHPLDETLIVQLKESVYSSHNL